MDREKGVKDWLAPLVVTTLLAINGWTLLEVINLKLSVITLTERFTLHEKLSSVGIVTMPDGGLRLANPKQSQ
jgi:hypothetical protein